MVDPRGLVRHDGLTYLDAWCHSAEAPRLFRLDRIADAEVLDTPVATPAEEPRDLCDGMFARSDETDPGHAAAARRPPAGSPSTTRSRRSTPAGADGRRTVEVDLLVADERWLTKLLLRLAPNASVTAPGVVRRRLTAAAQDALSLYRMTERVPSRRQPTEQDWAPMSTR